MELGFESRSLLIPKPLFFPPPCASYLYLVGCIFAAVEGSVSVRYPVPGGNCLEGGLLGDGFGFDA